MALMRGRLRKAIPDQRADSEAPATSLKPVPANGVSTKNILIVGAAEKARAFEKSLSHARFYRDP
jgi:hypothetical protein